MTLIASTNRLRDNQRQTKADNHPSAPVIIVIIIPINKCLLSADRFNKNTPIITGNTEGRGAYLQTEQTESGISPNQGLLLFGEEPSSA